VNEAKISSKNQVVVPRETREALGVASGDTLLFVVRGQHAIVIPKPKSYSKAIRGLMKGVYPPGYLKSERDSWE